MRCRLLVCGTQCRRCPDDVCSRCPNQFNGYRAQMAIQSIFHTALRAAASSARNGCGEQHEGRNEQDRPDYHKCRRRSVINLRCGTSAGTTTGVAVLLGVAVLPGVAVRPGDGVVVRVGEGAWPLLRTSGAYTRLVRSIVCARAATVTSTAVRHTMPAAVLNLTIVFHTPSESLGVTHCS